MKQKPLAAAIGALCATTLLGMVGAEAQESGIDEVVVTGSRIARDSATAAASPVAVLGGDTIRTAGQVDLGELLRESPALNNSLPANFSAIQSAGTTDSDVGLGLLNLRGLGAVRTLTLVNGRRHVAGGQGSAAVDVNSIPSVMLQRVETLTGGASSVYGADAVSGVVNFILRDGGDFDGIEVTAQTGVTDRWDANEQYVSIGTGFEFAEGRGEAVIAIEGLTNAEVLEDQRPFAGPYVGNDINATPAIAAANGLNPNATRLFVTPTTNPISSAQGVFNIASGDPFYESIRPGIAGVKAGTGIPLIPGTQIPVAQVVDSPFNGTPRVYNPGMPANVNQAYGIGDGLQSLRQTVLPPQERYSVNINGSYEITDSVSFFLESKYAFSENSNVQGVDFNDGIPIAYDNPYLSPALLQQISDLQGLGIIPPNPNDGRFYGFGASRDSDDLNVMPGDIVERETVRIVAGLEGEIDVADGIEYELSYNYGSTTVDTNNFNLRLEDRFYAALDSTIDPATGEIVCRSNIDPTALPIIGPGAYPVPVFVNDGGFSPFSKFTKFVSFTPGPNSGCAPFNPLGFNSTSQANADFVYVDALDVSELEQRVIFGSLAGTTSSFFELPAGAISWAAGVEYREEESTFTVNPYEETQNTWDGSNGNQVTGLAGEFDVLEYFAELNAPLLADIPLFELVELTGAYRYADYSTVGTNDAWSTGLRYSPGFGLTLRGTIAEAVRAPNISELYSPQQPNFFPFQDDPCSIDNINLGSPNRAGNCAALGVPAGYDVNDYITAGIPGVTGGNPLLSQEEAETVTAGIVYEPTFAPGLRLIVDYYSTEITGAIDALPSSRIAEACVDLGSINNQFCPLIQRAPEGYITYHASGQVNLGAFDVEGVDFGVDYGMELSSLGLDGMGALDFSLNGTNLLEFNEFQDPIDSSVFETRVGQFGYPEWIVNARASWSIADLTLTLASRWEDSQLLPGLSNNDFAGNPIFADPSQTGDSWVHDINFSYIFNERINIFGGLNNAFDRAPYLGSLTRPAGPRGRFGFLAVNFRI